MAEMYTFNGDLLEQRDCFKKEPHEDHKWHDLYYCSGRGLDNDGYVVPVSAPRQTRDVLLPVTKCSRIDEHIPHSWNYEDDDHTIGQVRHCPGIWVSDEEKELGEDGYVLPDRLKEMTREEFKDTYMDETAPAPGILDGRAAYGDRVQNMKEQAAMINAYLGTPPRAIEAHDVPIIFVLIKAHRLGKMPDYADNYNDIDGYMQIAREVIGDDMIEAATAKEYSQLKAVRDANTSVVEAEAVQAWLADHGIVSDVVTVDHSVPPRHQYENVERDAERDAMNERLRQSRNAR